MSAWLWGKLVRRRVVGGVGWEGQEEGEEEEEEEGEEEE